MARSKNPGRLQVAAEISDGLAAVLDARVKRDGLNRSIIIRRALMHELGVDADGQPVTNGDQP